MKMHIVAALLMSTGAALAAPQHEDWTVSHQPDRFQDHVLMEAFADADSGPGRMALYCDTETGFRVMFLPKSMLVPEGPAVTTLSIDGGKPVSLNADAFGDDDTDIVTVHGTDRIQRALAGARHVTVHFQGYTSGSGDAAFTFGDLAAQKKLVMKVCPIR